jgi:predicted MFS family arabinose efflux permease
LQQWPGMIGYGILHLITFGFLFFSYIFFCTIRETSLPPKKDPESQSYRQYLKSFPGLIRADGRLALYLSVKVLSASAFVVYSFLSVHVLSALHKTESFLGTLLMVQMAGMLIGNICGGWLGNRLGGRKVLLAGHGGFMVMALCAIVLTREWQAYLLFFIFGVAFYLERIGSLTFNMDLAPVEKRVVYFALFGVAKLIGLLLASLAGPMWQNYATELSYGPQITFLITCAPVVILMAASIFLIVLIPDPHFEQER